MGTILSKNKDPAEIFQSIFLDNALHGVAETATCSGLTHSSPALATDTAEIVSSVPFSDKPSSIYHDNLVQEGSKPESSGFLPNFNSFLSSCTAVENFHLCPTNEKPENGFFSREALGHARPASKSLFSDLDIFLSIADGVENPPKSPPTPPDEAPPIRKPELRTACVSSNHQGKKQFDTGGSKSEAVANVKDSPCPPQTEQEKPFKIWPNGYCSEKPASDTYTDPIIFPMWKDICFLCKLLDGIVIGLIIILLLGECLSCI